MVVINPVELGLGVVAYICNLSYSGGKDRRIMVLGQPRKMLVRLYLKNQPGMHVV
jgi:hypothetical protein